MQNEDIVFNAANMNMMLCITIPIVDDLLCEASETIITQLTENDPNVVLIPPTTSIVTIIDNDGMCSSICDTTRSTYTQS